MYTIPMTKTLKKIMKYIDQAIVDAYQDGYNDGTIDGRDSGFDEGLDEGVKAERNRIIGMFEMLYAVNMENGSANKAKQYYEVVQLIRVADEMEKQDWSEEGIAAWHKEDLEKDGF
jgi:hypothetical protein